MLDLFADAKPWQEPLAPGATILRRFAHRRAAEGRGTGLRGIRHRAQSLSGRVTAESAPGEGTTVSIALPLKEAP